MFVALRHVNGSVSDSYLAIGFGAAILLHRPVSGLSCLHDELLVAL